MKNLRKVRGITLISLIVTIIILLILAGISIQLIGGSNGILQRASQALDANDQATATEKMELKITYLNMISYGENTRKATLQELADGLFADKEVEYVKLKNQEVATLQPIDVTGESSFFVKLKEYSYEFEIDENLQLASVDGVKMATTNPSNEDLKTEVNELKTTIEEMKGTIASLQKKMEEQENGGQRVNLMDSPVVIPVTTTWTQGDFANIPLSQSIKEFKYMEIQYRVNGSTNLNLSFDVGTKFVPLENITLHNSNSVDWSNSSTFSLISFVDGDPSEGIGVVGWFKSENLLHFGCGKCQENNRKSITIDRIYGIK